MKRVFVLSMLTCLAMICSCQKQDSAAEQQLAQRKVELDAREKALDERVNALNERVNALAEKQKAMANARTTATDVQGQTLDPTQAQAERERTIQQFSSEMRALVPDDSKMKAESDGARRHALEKLQDQRQPKSKMSSGAVFPAPEATSPTPSPTVEVASPTLSPTPE